MNGKRLVDTLVWTIAIGRVLSDKEYKRVTKTNSKLYYTNGLSHAALRSPGTT